MTDLLLKERLQSFIESEGKSCSYDPELITPEYVYRMWGGIRLSNILPLRCKIKVLAVTEVHHYW